MFSAFALADIPKVTDDAETAVGEMNAIQPPFVVLDCPAVRSNLGAFRCEKGLTRLKRAAINADDFVGVFLFPEQMHDFFEVAPEHTTWDLPKCWQRDWVDLADPEIRIDQEHAQGRVIEQRFELCCAKT